MTPAAFAESASAMPQATQVTWLLSFGSLGLGLANPNPNPNPNPNQVTWLLSFG